MDARVDFDEGPWRPASLAPIYAAIGVLMAAALFGFAVALWPQASAASARGERESTSANPVLERQLRFAPDARPRMLRWT